MLPSYPLILASSSSDGTALTNTVTATSILSGSGISTLPAGALQCGSVLKLWARGRISTLSITPGTLTFDLRLGSVVVSNLGAINLNVTMQTNSSWALEIVAGIRTVGNGTSATAVVFASFMSRSVVGAPAVASGGSSMILLPDTAPASGVGFDSTVALPVNVFATWSTASTSNSIQVHQSLTELKV